MHYAHLFPLVSAPDLEGVISPRELRDVAGTQSLPCEPLEEVLVADARAGLTPAQMVERKLVLLLKTNPLPVSQIMARPRPLQGR